jgi:hypothetical protein
MRQQLGNIVSITTLKSFYSLSYRNGGRMILWHGTQNLLAFLLSAAHIS